MSGKTHVHTVAKTKDGFLVPSRSKDGWINGKGEAMKISASPKETKFFTPEAAKELGFSPTEVQKAALADYMKSLESSAPTPMVSTNVTPATPTK